MRSSSLHDSASKKATSSEEEDVGSPESIALVIYSFPWYAAIDKAQ